MVIIYCVIGIIVLLLLICVLRAAAMKPTPAKDAVFLKAPDTRAMDYAQILAPMLKCETISSYENANLEKFHGFHALIGELFPEFFKTCEKTELDGSLLFRWPGQGKAEPILLMGHHDVVAVSGEWTHPPFGGFIDGEKLWGRGAVDNKGALFSILQAVEELIKEGFRPEGDVYIASSCTEETDGAGAKATAEHLKEKGIRLALVLDEGGMIISEPIGGVKGIYAMVGVLEKACGEIHFVAKGKGGHASTPSKGSPISRLSAFVSYTEKHDLFRAEMTPTVKEMFRRLAPNAGFVMRLLLGNIWLFGPLLKKALPSLSPAAGAMIKTSCAFTMMQGSEAINVVPDMAWIAANPRFIQHQGADESLEILRKAAAKFDVEMNVISYEQACPAVDYNTQAFRHVEECVKTVYPDIDIIPYALTGASDSRFYSIVCDNCLRLAPLYLDDQQLNSMHAIDESVYIASLPKAVDIYKNVVRGWH